MKHKNSNGRHLPSLEIREEDNRLSTPPVRASAVKLGWTSFLEGTALEVAFFASQWLQYFSIFVIRLLPEPEVRSDIRTDIQSGDGVSSVRHGR